MLLSKRERSMVDTVGKDPFLSIAKRLRQSSALALTPMGPFNTAPGTGIGDRRARRARYSGTCDAMCLEWRGWWACGAATRARVQP